MGVIYIARDGRACIKTSHTTKNGLLRLKYDLNLKGVKVRSVDEVIRYLMEEQR